MKGEPIVGPGDGWESKPVKIKLKMLRYGFLSIGWLVPLAVFSGLGRYTANFGISENLFYLLLAVMAFV